MKKIKSIFLILIVAFMLLMAVGIIKGSTIFGGTNDLIDPVPIPFTAASILE